MEIDRSIYIECIFGDNTGAKYGIHEGINKIGKGYQMDICVSDDIQITRDNHCSIICDSGTKELILAPTMGSLTYLNNSLIKEPTIVKDKDVFRIGRSEFVIHID